MWYSIEAQHGYAFRLQRGSLAASPSVEEALGEFLLDSLMGHERLKEIAARLGLTAAVTHFESRISSQPNLRTGDFGEVVAARLLEAVEDYVIPIEKLRYRISPNLPMPLTDVLCIELHEGEIVGLAFCEAKAGTSAPPTDLAKAAFVQAAKEFENDEPPILFFALDRLVDKGDWETYEQLDDALTNPSPIDRALRLVFVFDDVAWSDTILDTLDDAFVGNELTLPEDFMIYALTRNDMKAVISKSYLLAQRMASNG